MHTVRRTISLGFTAEPAEEGLHACYIFNDEEERRRVMAKYLESGVLADEKVLYLVDMMTPKEMLDCLRDLGIDLRSKEPQLTIAEAGPAYCPTGVFQPDEMLGLLREFYTEAIADGHSGSRATGEMTWCLEGGRTNEEQLMEYEARLNLLVKEYPCTLCCQYAAERFDGPTIMDELSVHPAMIVRGQLVKNPYFMDPAVFLEGLRTRKGTGLGT